MLIKTFEKIDSHFIYMLIVGIIIRFLSFLFVPIVDDTISYIESARFIIEINYTSLRPPGFPLLLVPFLLLTGDGAFSAKIVSFIISILLILCSYYVYMKAFMNLFKDSKRREQKAKKIGLLASFLLIFNLFFIFHSGKGLREELIALLYLVLFYFIIIKDKLSLRDNICLSLIICLLILTQLSTSFFIVVAIVIFFIVSKFKRFQFKPISNKKFFIILASFICSFFLWAIFSMYKWGDPLANWNTQGAWFGIKYGVDLSSFEGIINAGLNALTFGLPSIFIFLFVYFGFAFILIMLYFLIKNLRNKQLLFIFLAVGLNYAYLTIYITTPRVIMYFFYILLYIGALPLGIFLVKLENKDVTTIKKTNYLLYTYLISYVLRGLDTLSIIYLVYQIYNYLPHFSDVDTIISIFAQTLNPIILTITFILIVINEGSLVLILISNKDLLSFKLKGNQDNFNRKINNDKSFKENGKFQKSKKDK